MTKLNRLKLEARASCITRGHTMQRFTDQKRYASKAEIVAHSICNDCDEWVQVMHPQANEIEIGGPAVALNCTKTKPSK